MYGYITAILKKYNLDSSKLSKYHPVSQLSSISKTMECIVSRKIIYFIISNYIVDCFQSAYLYNLIRETYLQIIFNEIILSIDNKAYYLLLIIDLSSTFDTLNHSSIPYLLHIPG